MTTDHDDTETEKRLDELYKLDFAGGKSIRYHAYRRSFWLGFDHWNKILTIVAGTSVVIAIFGNDTQAAKILALVVAALSAADIVLGFSDRANTHDHLYRDWCRFMEDVASLEAGVPTRHDIARLKTKRQRIERDEPGILDWLERRCAAEECIARGQREYLDPLWKLNFLQIWFSQWAMWPTLR